MEMRFNSKIWKNKLIQLGLVMIFMIDFYGDFYGLK